MVIEHAKTPRIGVQSLMYVGDDPSVASGKPWIFLAALVGLWWLASRR